MQVRHLRYGDKTLRDGRGLYLVPQSSGRHAWRFDYRFHGVRKTLSMGLYPDTSLAEARQRRDDALRALGSGKDPSALRQAAKAQQEAANQEAREAAENTFATIAAEWLDRQNLADVTVAKSRWLLNAFLLPELGARPVRELSKAPREILAVLRKIEATGKLETARRAQVKLGQVFRYALLEGKADADPTASLRGALKSPKVRHHASVTDPAAIGALMRAIDGFAGQPVTLAALQFAPLVFVRPGELRPAEWTEFELGAP
ncbi:MAG: DUF4102 domain-containing protein, partial [Lysobacteraceae bacterium]